MWLWITLGALAALTGIALLLKRKKLLLIPGVLALVMAVCTAICFTPPAYQELEPDYAVLLGVALEDGKPTDELVRRMELALDWLSDTPDLTLIVTGGDARDLGITEAEVMAGWLEEHGADMTRVLIEDQAQDTRQNLLYSKTLAHGQGMESDTVLILTSEYHQTRAQFLARQNGPTATGISCQTPLYPRITASVREVYSFVKAILETL